jgi:hypothetical protein
MPCGVLYRKNVFWKTLRTASAEWNGNVDWVPSRLETLPQEMNLQTENLRMRKGWTYFRVLVAVVLAVAAIAKLLNVTEILAGNGILSNRRLLSLTIGVEAGVACFLLLSNTFWSWAVTAGVFLIFSGASMYAIASGQDCNCISQRIGPKIMLPFDLTILAIAYWVRPAVSFNWNRRYMLQISCSVVVGLFVAAVATYYNPAEKSDPLQFLLADMLIEKSWPLDARLHPDLAELDEGNWMVVVVRRDCEHCRELLAKHFADPHAHRPNERTAVFVAGESKWPFMLDEIAVESSSNRSFTWPGNEPFVASPAIFLLRNGRVANAKDGNDADAFVEELLSITP